MLSEMLCYLREVADVGATGKDYRRSAAYAWTPLHSRSAHDGSRRLGTALRGTVAREHLGRLSVFGRSRHRRVSRLCRPSGRSPDHSGEIACLTWSMLSFHQHWRRPCVALDTMRPMLAS